MNIIVTGGAGFIGSNFDHIGARPPVLNCKRKMNKK